MLIKPCASEPDTRMHGAFGVAPAAGIASGAAPAGSKAIMDKLAEDHAGAAVLIVRLEAP